MKKLQENCSFFGDCINHVRSFVMGPRKLLYVIGGFIDSLVLSALQRATHRLPRRPPQTIKRACQSAILHDPMADKTADPDNFSYFKNLFLHFTPSFQSLLSFFLSFYLLEMNPSDDDEELVRDMLDYGMRYYEHMIQQ